MLLHTLYNTDSVESLGLPVFLSVLIAGGYKQSRNKELYVRGLNIMKYFKNCVLHFFFCTFTHFKHTYIFSCSRSEQFKNFFIAVTYSQKEAGYLWTWFEPSATLLQPGALTIELRRTLPLLRRTHKTGRQHFLINFTWFYVIKRRHLQAAAATPVKKNRKTARGLGISAEPQSLKSLQVYGIFTSEMHRKYPFNIICSVCFFLDSFPELWR